MSVANGEAASAAVFNSSFVSREVDTDTVGKLNLKNTSSTHVTDLQQVIANLISVAGMLTQNNTSLVYSSTNYIMNGTSLKTAIGVLDTSIRNVSDALVSASAGSGAGGGSNWQPVAGFAPQEDYEFNEKVWKIGPDLDQALELWVKVPSVYIPGRQGSLTIGVYSPSTSDNWKLEVVSTLIIINVDAINSTTNQEGFVSSDYNNTLTSSYRFYGVPLRITDIAGQINGIAVSPNDLIKLTLRRTAPTGSDDAADLRIVPSYTEVSFL